MPESEHYAQICTASLDPATGGAELCAGQVSLAHPKSGGVLASGYTRSLPALSARVSAGVGHLVQAFCSRDTFRVKGTSTSKFVFWKCLEGKWHKNMRISEQR